MDEPLEEIALVRRRLAPLVLELLVRLEVGARADQLEAGFKTHFHTTCGIFRHPWRVLVSRPWRRSCSPGSTCSSGEARGGLLPAHKLVTTDSVSTPDLVIADIARVEPEEVVDARPDIPIVGFTNHTDRAGLQRAHTAGFDQVIVKSALVERAGELVDELARED